MTAGQRSSIPEDMLWQAKNVGTDLDGMLMKRPGLRQWGQTIKVPDTSSSGSSVTRFEPLLNTLGELVLVETGSSGKFSRTITNGEVTVRAKESSGGQTYTLSSIVDTLSTGDEWSLRFRFRGTNLPAYTADSTASDTFSVQGQAKTTTGKEFAIWSGGIYYQQNSDSKYVLVTGSESAGEGGWSTIEIRCDDAAGNTTVHLNDTLLQTITSADIKDQTLATKAAFHLKWVVEGSATAGTQYSTRVSTPMYNDTITDPFKVVPVVALTDFHYITKSRSKKSAMLCAAGNYIYHDDALEKSWRPLKPKQHDNVVFLEFRRTIVWVDTNGSSFSSLWQWNGYNDPELLDDAPPVRFAAEHQQRLFSAGDRNNPLRVYYSGDRQPNLWFSPAPDNIEDEFDTLLQAGYIEIPARGGTEVTAIWGDIFGLLIIFTDNGVWKLSGSGPSSYDLDDISTKIGCVGPEALTQVGKDLWFVGRHGVGTVATTEKSGELRVDMPSFPIQDLWSASAFSPNKISKGFQHTARMSFYASENLVYIAVPLSGERIAESVYIFNILSKQWYGPWNIDSQAMELVEVSSPTIDVMMHAGDNGIVAHTNYSVKGDWRTTSYEFLLETAMINGRSIDPQLASMEKVFAELRLMVVPRGKWDFTVKYWTDTNPAPETKTRNQNDIYNVSTLTEDFVLDVDGDPGGRLHAADEIAVIEILLDERGKGLSIQIAQSGLEEDFVLQGYEVDILVAGYEED